MNVYTSPGIKTPEDHASEIWQIQKEKISQKTRKREVVEARMVLIKYQREHKKKSQDAAALMYGLQGHCATIHAIKTIGNLIVSDKQFNERYTEFREKVGWE